MIATRYETHNMPNPLLPFIYHPIFSLKQVQKSPNWHENIELLQCTSGSGYVLCGTERIPMEEGHLIIVNTDTLHAMGTEDQMTYRCLIIDNSFFVSNGAPISQLYFRHTITDKAVCDLFSHIARSYENLDTQNYMDILAVRTQILQLIGMLCAHHTIQRPNIPSNEYVKSAMIYLRKHMAQSVSLDDLAAHVGISKYHLSRQFKLFTGKTVVQTLNLMRCTEARRLIKNGMPVSTAAASCGFDNLSYFTRTYKKYFHTLPSSSK